jgi:hypothetical protein
MSVSAAIKATKPAAITAQLVDVRNIATHKCVRLEIHVPAEQAGLVLAAFGWPTMVDPIPVAIARLDTDVAPLKLIEALGEPQETEYQKGAAILDRLQKPRRPFCELTFSQQAGIRSEDVAFQLWLSPKSEPGEDCADVIRRMCGVTSRSQIIKGTQAGDRWTYMLREYERNYAP